MSTAFILGGAGAVAELVGFILRGSGAESRREAVKRYNQVVAPDEDLSMILSPYSGSPIIELTQRF